MAFIQVIDARVNTQCMQCLDSADSQHQFLTNSGPLVAAVQAERMLTNINSNKDELLQLLLIGQPELRDIISRPDMKQFAQRIAVDYHLEALSLEETCG